MADIGDKLRSAREAKGLSIADIEKATKIQGRYLTAIEQNDFDKLPGDFYVRAFIRQYAQIVGLDGKELLSEYHQDVPESNPDEYVENSIDNKSEEVKETTDNKKNLWKNYLPRIAVGLGVIIVILVVYVLYAHLSSGGQDNNNANSNVTVSSQKSSSKKKAAPVVKKNAVKIIKIAANEYRVVGLKNNRKLVVKAGNQTINASVAINGVINWQQSLTSSAKHTMTLPANAKKVVITFDNDNGTSVKIGGKRVPYAPSGSRLSLTLLIGKKAKAAKKNNNSGSSANTNNTNNNSDNNNDNSGSTDNNNSGSNTTNRNNRRSTQTSQRQSSSRQTQQSSSTAQSSSTQQSTNNNTQSSRQTQQSSQKQSTTTTTGSTGDNGGNNQ